MPLTLMGYILRDLLKLLVLATAVLVLVMSMGFLIGPLSEGGLGAMAVLKLLIYVMPGMLTYALPIATAFASTLVFFRLAADNEITACAVSGVSYRTLLIPPLLLGLAVMVSLFFLSNWVIPEFWLRVERIAQRDVTRMIVEQISRKQVVRLNDYILYADEARAIDPPRAAPCELQPYQRIALIHPVGAELRPNTGEVETDFTAEQAVADLYRLGGQTYATIQVAQAAIKDPRTGTLVNLERHVLPSQEIPSFFKSKPKFLSLERLREVSDDPGRFPDIRKHVDRLREALARQQAIAYMFSELSGGEHGGVLHLSAPPRRSAGGMGESSAANRARTPMTLSAPNVRRKGDALILTASADRRVHAEIGHYTEQKQHHDADRAEIEVVAGANEPHVLIKLSGAERNTAYLPPARLGRPVSPVPIMAGLADQSWQPLIARAAASENDDLVEQATGLQDRIARLRTRIKVTVHERGAMAVSSALIMLLGAVMAMLLRLQVPLVIFFWCFLPAVVAIFMINGGKNIVRSDAQGGWLDGMVIWSGNLFLIAVVVGVYLRLARH